MKYFTLLTMLLGTSGVSMAQARDDAATRPAAESTNQESSPDLAAIRAGSEAFVAAFKAGDAKRLAAMWTEDGEYLDEMGERFAGRAAIEQAYTKFFSDHPGATIQVVIDSLRQVSPNTVIEDGRTMVVDAAATRSAATRYTAVHTQVDGRWLMASVQDAPVEASMAEQSAADLNWLVGSWEAQEHGVHQESVCQWVADGRFIERRYTTTHHDGEKTSGIQLIGWNPRDGQVQSWDFSPDGGVAVGVWYPVDGGWQTRVDGTTGSGTRTSAINRLIRLDDNAYAWQSTRRYRGETALPDTDEVVIRRRPTK